MNQSQQICPNCQIPLRPKERSHEQMQAEILRRNGIEPGDVIDYTSGEVRKIPLNELQDRLDQYDQERVR